MHLVLLILRGRERRAGHNVGPANETPVLLDSPRKRDLFADLGTRGAGQGQAGRIGLDGHNLGARRGTADVDHENFVLRELGDLGLLAVGRLDTQQAAQQEVVDLELRVDGGQLATETQDETDQTIGTAERGVDAGTNT